MVDLLIVGAGPTGIAVGCEAKQRGLNILLMDKGALTQNFLDYPTYLRFFTTRDRMEIAGIPMSIPDDQANRQQALVYYRGVAARFDLPLALHEELLHAGRQADGTFAARTHWRGKERVRHAKSVCLATGYFDRSIKPGVPGEDLPWVRYRYKEAYPHFGEHVLLVGGGNSACKIALELWRNGAQVTMAVRDAAFKPGIKYWILPDLENRIEEGRIAARFETVVAAFQDDPRGARLRAKDGREDFLACDACYVQIGYRPDAELFKRCGIEIDEATLVPTFDPRTLESNVPGVYLAGTIQAGLDTGAIFIDNSRDHCVKIVDHLSKRLRS